MRYVCVSPMTGQIAGPRKAAIALRAGDEIRELDDGRFSLVTIRTVTLFPPTVSVASQVFTLAEHDRARLDPLPS